MGEGGVEPGKPPPVASLERALDQVVDFLGRAEQTARVRALLIESRRLRNAVGNWRSIAPDPEVREEMIARVLRLANDAEEVVATERAADAAAEPGSTFGAPGRLTAPSAPNPTPAAKAALAATMPALPPAPQGPPPPPQGPRRPDAPTVRMQVPPVETPTLIVPTRTRPEAATVRMLDPSSLDAPTIRMAAPPEFAHSPPPAAPPQAPAAPPRADLRTTAFGLGPERAHGRPAPAGAMLDLEMPPAIDAPADADPAPPAATQDDALMPPPVLPRLPSLQFDRVFTPPARDVEIVDAPAWARRRPLGDTVKIEAATPEPSRALAKRPAIAQEDTFDGPPSLLIEELPKLPAHGPPSARPDQVEARPAPLPRPETLDPHLVLLRDPYSARADAYRALRRKLAAGSARTIAVTSAAPKEGKTICAVNLALALRETSRGRILLVEANIRSPAIAALLGIQPPRCFTEQLRSHRENPLEPWVVVETGAAAAAPPASAADAAQAAPEAGAKPAEPARAAAAPLHVLAVDGRTNRPPILDAVTFSMGMESLKRAGYDFIVVDTPPVLGTMDMNVIGDSVDGVILTSIVKKSTRKAMRQAIEQLQPAPVLGVVLLER